MMPSSSSSPCRKRAWEETVVSAATGSIADSAVAAVVSSYGELSCVDEQLEHLDWLVMEVNCVVSEAERAPAALTTWPLRWWLRNLREAAREGGEVARSFRLRRRSRQRTVARRPGGEDGAARRRRHGQAGPRAAEAGEVLRGRCDDSGGLDGGAAVAPPRTGMVHLVTLCVPSLLRLLCARVACEVSEMVLWVKRAGALAG